MKQKKIIASVDTGGTKILVSLIDSEGKIITIKKKASKVKEQSNNIIKRIISAISKAVEEADPELYHLAGIVIGIPGIINPNTGIVYMAPNLKLKNTNIAKPLQSFFKVPVILENDANLGTIGIHKYETEGIHSILIGIFIGTGIGSGIIINDKIFYGKNFCAGEIGHMVIKENGYKCGCGQFGCFETVASRTAIARDIQNAINEGKRTKIKALIGKNQLIKSGTLARALELNDKLTQKTLTTASETIGKMIANLSNLLNIDCFVLAGGVIEACGSFMLPVIKESAKNFSLLQNFKGVKIIKSKLGDNAAIYGGYVLAKQNSIF